ncbi:MULTISPECIES: CPBP family intramembrane glutamic endopeptidase [Haloferax]|uniref:CPBP family intramembrane glutamic endopeptidase n=1 Tax=Haloferax TaxID=2251 RepID=UPI001F3693CC|nr:MULTISPECIES: type II CAAX endopeptidase family protein [Haloferax]
MALARGDVLLVVMPAIATAVRTHRFVSFVALTFLFTWLAWVPAALLVSAERIVPVSLLVLAGGFGPFLAAIVVAAATGDLRPWLRHVVSPRAPPFVWVAAAVLPPVLFGATLAFTVALGWTFESAALGPATLFAALLVSSFIRGGLEEPGWRGFGLPVLQRRLGAFRASLVIGVVWAAWHAPLFAMPGSSQAGTSFAFYLVSVVGISVVTTWLYNESGGRVLVPVAFHSVWNATSVFLSTGISGDGLLPAEAALAAAAWLFVGVLVYRYGAARLSSKPLPTNGLSFAGERTRKAELPREDGPARSLD